MKRALLFGGVPVIAGIALIGMWLVSDQAASRGNDWTQVLATIESVHPQEDALHIAYRYEYRGQQQRNAEGLLTVPPNARSGTFTARYAAGRQILAYVNPTSPAESMLEPRPHPSQVNLIAGVVLLIIGLPVGGYLLRQKPAGRANRKKKVRNPSKPLSRLKPPPSLPRK